MKTKQRKFYKQNEIIIFVMVFILMFIPISIFALNSELIIGDEIINYQNVMKMINGYKIYVDCNVIITPIFYYIGVLFLKIFGNKLLHLKI